MWFTPNVGIWCALRLNLATLFESWKCMMRPGARPPNHHADETSLIEGPWRYFHRLQGFRRCGIVALSGRHTYATSESFLISLLMSHCAKPIID